MKYFILPLMLILLSSFAFGLCLTPSEDLTITGGVQCGGSTCYICNNGGTPWYFNDTGSDGVILGATSDIVVDCNGTTIIGNGTGTGINFTGYNNVTIKNCNISTYSRGIILRNSVGSNVSNNTFLDNDYGVRSRNCDGCNFNRNYFYNNTGRGLNLPNSGIDSVVEYNNFVNNTNTLYIEFGNNNITIRHNNLTQQSGKVGINLRQIGNATVIFNRIIGVENDSDPASNAITAYDVSGGDHNISYNYIIGHEYGIRLDGDNNNSLISYNNLTGQGKWGIATNCEGTTIDNNNITYSYWNLIHFTNSSHTITNNYLANYLHHGTDTHSDGNETAGWDTIIHSNYITQTNHTAPWKDGGNGIYLNQAVNITVYNNTLIHLWNETQRDGIGRGISPQNGTLNKIYNNSMYNISGNCIHDQDRNSLFYDNVMSHCDGIRPLGYFPTGVDQINYNVYSNNTDLTGTLYFHIDNERIDLTIANQSSSFIINYSTNTLGGNVTILRTPSYVTQMVNRSDSVNVFGKTNQTIEYEMKPNDEYDVNYFAGDCMGVTSNQRVMVDTTFCNDTYYVQDTDGNGALYVAIGSNSNIILNGNGARLIGNASGRGFRSINNNNITLTNFQIENFSNNVYLQNCNNCSLINGTFLYGVGSNNVFATLMRDFEVYGNVMKNSSGSSSTFYISGATYNQTYDVNVYNNSISGGTSNCMHNNFDGSINAVQDILIHDNTFFDCPFGIDFSGTDGAKLYDNTFINMSQRGVRLWWDDSICEPHNCSAYNTEIYNNTFIDMNWSVYFIYNYTFGTLIHNNTYSQVNMGEYTKGIIDVKHGNGILNFTVNETAPYHSIYWMENTGVANFTSNVLHYFSVQNNTVNVYRTPSYIHEVINLSDNSDVFGLTNQTTTFDVDSSGNYRIDYQSGDCIGVTDDMSITTDTTLCDDTYNVADTGTDGIIVFNAAVDLTCDNTIISGANTTSGMFIDANFQDGVTVTGCTIQNFYNGIYSSWTDDSVFTQNTFNNISNQGIRALHGNNNNYTYNTFTNTVVQTYADTNGTGRNTTGIGILLSLSDSKYNIIEYNSFDKMKYGIQLSSVTENHTIRFNNFTSTGSNGYSVFIEANNNYTLVHDNLFVNGSWDVIVSRGSFNIIRDNTIYDWYHHGIDTLISDSTDSVNATSTHIYNNVLSDTALPDPVYNTSSYCIYVNQLHDSNVYSNDCNNSNIVGYGNKSNTYNNNFYLNTIRNASQFGMYILNLNGSIYNNTIYAVNQFGADKHSIHTGSWYNDLSQESTLSFDNNIFPDNWAIYRINNGNSNLTINETVDYHLVEHANAGKVNFTSNIRHDFRVENTSITVNPTTSYYSRTINLSDNSIIQDYINSTYSFKVGSSNNLLVEYSQNPPVVTLNSPPDTSTQAGANKNVTFNCSATDNMQLTNITLYIWDTNSVEYYSNTQTVNGTSSTVTWNVYVQPDGAYEWNCEAFDNNTMHATAPANFTINLDTYSFFAGGTTFTPVLSNVTYITPPEGFYAVQVAVGNWCLNITTSPTLSGSYCMNASSPTNITLGYSSVVNVNIYDEQTQAIINDRNVTIDLIGDSYSHNYTTDTGGLLISNLTLGSWEIRYNAQDYNARSYFFTLVGTTNPTIDLYLLTDNTSVSDRVVLTLLDEYSDPAVDITVLLQRNYIIGNLSVFNTVGMSKTNFEGEAVLYVEPFDVWYRMMYRTEDGTILKITTPSPFLVADPVDTVVLTEDALYSWRTYNSVSYNLSFVNDSGTIYARFIYSDSTNLVRSGCLHVQRVTALDVYDICNNCTNSIAATLSCLIDPTLEGQYKANALIDSNTANSWYTLDSSFFEVLDTVQFAQEGIFWGTMMIGSMVLMGVATLTGSILFLILGVIGVSVMGIVTGFNIGFIWWFAMLGLIVLFLIVRRQQ